MCVGYAAPPEQAIMVGFVHLHLHSAYSLLEGALPIARLAELAKPTTSRP
jgi:DNA polymerase III alpha subunit